METEKDKFLDKLIDKLQGGSNGLSVEDFARLHDLEPELMLMRSVEHAIETTPVNEAAMRSGKAALLAKINELSSAVKAAEAQAVGIPHRGKNPAQPMLWANIANWLRGLQPAYAGGFAGALAVAVVFIGLVAGSAGSIPGMTLYPAKLAIESLQLRFTPSDSDEAALHLTFAERRLGEAQELVRTNEYSFIEPTLMSFEKSLDKGLQLARNADIKTKNELTDHAAQLSSQEEAIVKNAMTKVSPGVKEEIAVFLGPTDGNKNSGAENEDSDGSGSATSDSQDSQDGDDELVDGDSGSLHNDPTSTTTSISSLSSSVVPQIDSLELSTSVLSPNNDGRLEFLTIEVKGDAGQALFISILDIYGKAILKSSALNAISDSGENYGYEWNGKTSVGDYASDGSYIVVISSSGGSMSSHRGEFRIDTDEPATPVLVAPGNGLIVSSDVLTISWKSVNDAEKYILEYSTEIGLSSGGQKSISTSTTSQSLDLSYAPSDTKIYWRVTAEDAAGNRSNASPERSFTIAN